MTKSGIKTTEFWLTLLPIVGTWAMAIKDLVPAEYATIMTAIASSAYAISRGLAKKEAKN
jgi:hypothetical protein